MPFILPILPGHSRSAIFTQCGDPCAQCLLFYRIILSYFGWAHRITFHSVPQPTHSFVLLTIRLAAVYFLTRTSLETGISVDATTPFIF
jgi:hypothetical protein